MKDPDTCHDAAVDAVRDEVLAMKLPADEAEALIDDRLDKVQNSLSKFVEYGEYVGIEFDTAAGTARVLTVAEIRERDRLDKVQNSLSKFVEYGGSDNGGF